jgi:tRNA1(Val) A37 N6-methylase TrmN6
MIVKNKLLNYSNAYIYQDTEYFKMSLDSLLLAKFVTINMRDKNIIDLATGNAPHISIIILSISKFIFKFLFK